MQLLGSKRLHTTAYHPISNGLVERFHRQLKAALKCQPTPNNWVSALPMILLGIHTALKEDLHCSTAELVYGTSLRLPGEFFDRSSSPEVDTAAYVSKLKQSMQNLQVPPTRFPKQRQTYVDKALSTCTHVFVRHDAPLQAPYDGPYEVLQRKGKYYVLRVNGQDRRVSLDRLKPAHLDTGEDDATPHPHQQPPHRHQSRHLTAVLGNFAKTVCKLAKKFYCACLCPCA